MFYNVSRGRRVSCPSSLIETEGEAELVRGCINKKFPASAIIESLGLKNDNAGPSSPVFNDLDVRALDKRVKTAMYGFMQSGRSAAELKEALPKADTFETDVESICFDFGHRIWGLPKRIHLLSAGSKKNYPRDLYWEDDQDQKAIKIYIRCWIIKRAARRIEEDERRAKENLKIRTPASATKSKFPLKLRERPQESDSDISDVELVRTFSPKKTTPAATTMRTKIAEGLFRAPPARMYSTPPEAQQQNLFRKYQSPLFEPDHNAPQQTEEREEGECSHDDLYEDPPPEQRPSSLDAPVSPPGLNKRKRVDLDSSQSQSQEAVPGKLPKVHPEIWQRAIPEMPKNRQNEGQSNDVYDVPQSPSTITTGLLPMEFGRRRRIDETQESDPDYEPSRESSPDTDEDDDEPLLGGHFALASQVLVEAVPATPSPPLTPAHDVSMNDINTPKNDVERTNRATEHDMANSDEGDNDEDHDAAIAHPADFTRARSATVSFGVSIQARNAGARERDLRLELLKLLLSRLNNLNQFQSSATEAEIAERRLDELLYLLWEQDWASLQQEKGLGFNDLQTSYATWISMRNRLREFQVGARYFGRPGEEWKSHLRSMGNKDERAAALISLVELQQEMLSLGDLEIYHFNECLMIVFDALTQFSGGNGAEEFEGIKRYNEALLEWFNL